MKLKIALVTVMLLAVMLLLIAAPALAADMTFFPTQPMLDDDKGVQIQIDRIVVSDQAMGFSIFNYPPEVYQFFTVYYHIYNPTDHLINYQFNLTLVDDLNRAYASEEFTLAEGIDSGSRLPRQKEFAVYRNASDIWLLWTHINRETNEYAYTKIGIEQEVTPTPTIVPTPTAIPVGVTTPTPLATPTEAPTPTPGSGQCLPLLPAALLLGSFGLVGVLTQRYGRK